MGQKEIQDDLTGERFGRLVVIEYHMEIRSPGDQEKLYLCKCDCGNEKWVKRRGLVSGSTKSCGCLRRELSTKRSKDRSKDLTGKRFGRLFVERYLDDKGGSARYLCRCDCGYYKIISGNSLRGGGTNSCGCLVRETSSERGKNRLIDLTGKVFGKFTVVRRVENYVSPNGDEHPQWECRCECGNIKIVAGGDLRRKDGKAVQSCGCLGLESPIAVGLKNYCVETYSAIPEYPEFKNPDTRYSLPFDIYIPTKSFFIEVHGKQHYSFTEYFNKTQEDFEYRQHLDQIKKEYAEQHGTFIEIDLRKIKTIEEAIEYVESFIK